jgi:hypothetical protein
VISNSNSSDRLVLQEYHTGRKSYAITCRQIACRQCAPRFGAGAMPWRIGARGRGAVGQLRGEVSYAPGSLYRLRFVYTQSWETHLTGTLGSEEQYFFFAEGRCEGRISGHFRAANAPRRRTPSADEPEQLLGPPSPHGTRTGGLGGRSRGDVHGDRNLRGN